MATERMGTDPWQGLNGPNLGYVQDQYDLYLDDPSAVDPELKALFDQFGAPPSGDVAAASATANQSYSGPNVEKVLAAVKLIQAIRKDGHLIAQFYPLNVKVDRANGVKLELSDYGLTEDDLKSIPAQVVYDNPNGSMRHALDVVNQLKKAYTGYLAFEFEHIEETAEREWLEHKIESGNYLRSFDAEERKQLLKRLTEVEGLEKFLHKTFVGQKRFSIEGVDVLVPMLDELVKKSLENKTRDIVIGMAHRGRLNVLAHVVDKPYKKLLSEFNHTPESEKSEWTNEGWTGDVKYHLGGVRKIKENGQVVARVTLANNPSHLEFVNPVVEGYARASQDDRSNPGYPTQEESLALPVVIHGDAAFIGEGVVAETLNLSQIDAYKTGGTINIIANNLIGFTTESHQGRSTRYSSDLAKGFDIPVIHVNADEPEACLSAIDLAYEYRQLFKKDILINLAGYRRYGHNEMDDPMATNPVLYSMVNAHETVRVLYGKALQELGVVDQAYVDQLDQQVQDHLQAVYDEIRASSNGQVEELEPPASVADGLPAVDTTVPAEALQEINENLLKWPESFTVYPKLKRILERRSGVFEKNGKIDWAHAEALALASIVSDGTPIRFTGQDSERGTFAHRHLVLHDSKTGETYSPIHTLPSAKASFALHNSPLSEVAVLGFEYGYNVFAPETMVIWEAQFGDFANVAQVLFDQFISSARAKWGQKSGLVMLLPHGFEGQGPEHSSARLERFLQLAAENNWTVANLSSAANYFHLLRRQAALMGTDYIRPLVVVTPKSLLRNQVVASSPSEFTEGTFQPVIEHPAAKGTLADVERLVLSSGKMAMDLAADLEASEADHSWVRMLRVEEIYPFAEEALSAQFKRFKNLKEIVWVQEEPKNMGAWFYMEPRLRALAPKGVNLSYVGRPDRSSPATGEPGIHKSEQSRIIKEALYR
ncbi:2-oxoglutarate dehydrogenase E1 component [Pullulanibacillus sp. KACC 23026]|uniref:2-oxoglutarate dehydrogenase E1 component n=1 Tax=Pullulanibacillus sp. KACC 23026 TaxID=3028315 RepID=UPI0023B1AA8F|nr:2-oxoglutarate dehydrogenase E1 component [Pullulanibacillus sp. KACC 23026]WEG14108.1 2-oxoglutarate dehydrogenase E1 component [Pullulanibacillus sp. KACC 23026]